MNKKTYTFVKEDAVLRFDSDCDFEIRADVETDDELSLLTEGEITKSAEA